MKCNSTAAGLSETEVGAVCRQGTWESILQPVLNAVFGKEQKLGSRAQSPSVQVMGGGVGWADVLCTCSLEAPSAGEAGESKEENRVDPGFYFYSRRPLLCFREA